MLSSPGKEPAGRWRFHKGLVFTPASPQQRGQQLRAACEATGEISSQQEENGRGGRWRAPLPTPTKRGIYPLVPTAAGAEGCSVPCEPTGPAAGRRQSPSCRMSPSVAAARGDRPQGPCPGRGTQLREAPGAFKAASPPRCTQSTSGSRGLPGLHDARPVFPAFLPAHLQRLFLKKIKIKINNIHSFLKALPQREMLLLLNLALVWK